MEIISEHLATISRQFDSEFYYVSMADYEFLSVQWIMSDNRLNNDRINLEVF